MLDRLVIWQHYVLAMIQIVCGNEKINAKSIISILTAGIYSGSEIVLRIEGKDEQEAGDAVSNLIRNLKD